MDITAMVLIADFMALLMNVPSILIIVSVTNKIDRYFKIGQFSNFL